MPLSEQDLRLQDRIMVADENGKEQVVFNWVTVEQSSVVRGSNPSIELNTERIYAGDGQGTPDAVTHWVAEAIHTEYGTDVALKGIDVVDPTADEVDVI